MVTFFFLNMLNTSFFLNDTFSFICFTIDVFFFVFFGHKMHVMPKHFLCKIFIFFSMIHFLSYVLLLICFFKIFVWHTMHAVS